ncbi:hypothetical protein LOZ36_006858 [Ophidiomyces ophidiicola]|nr:hypothetical protein LOZ36_006858 [Ophidiomyces ophidiicola]
MAPSSRSSDGPPGLGYLPAPQPRSGTSTGSSSPNEMPASGPIRPSFAVNGLSSSNSSLGSARRTAGSPSHELSARFYSKRTREIKAQEGVSPGIWGPPTSGNSTPLRENIPESPSQDEFPDLVPLSEPNLCSPARRARADTVPSRFQPVGAPNGLPSSSSATISKSSRPTPSTSPFRPPGLDSLRAAGSGSAPLMSRLRAGSMPQRSPLVTSSNPFGPGLFSTNWTRDRTPTLTSIRSSEGPGSPSQSSISRDGLADTGVKTLNYLGLIETPEPTGATLAHSSADLLMRQQQQQQAASTMLPDMNLVNRGANRFRSYSVNAKEKYAENEERLRQSSTPQSGLINPAAAAAVAEMQATQVQILQHNLAVQAFANHTSISRPRARTAGVLDAPLQRSAIQGYFPAPSRLDYGRSPGDVGIAEAGEYEELQDAVQMMHLGGRSGIDGAEDGVIEGPTRALWIGSIPVSTTVTSLDAIFSRFGKIESTRVLTHKNCGFVNFERLDNAIKAKTEVNGKEIFPGAGPVRIGFAKVPVSPTSETPGRSDAQSSPTPESTTPNHAPEGVCGTENENGDQADVPKIPELSELVTEMLRIVVEFGASDAERDSIAESINRAIEYCSFRDEISPVPEPSPTRTFDAPKIRELRKRIDNGTCSVQEIEDAAMLMLPEIVDLSSDYLGNTVVQKLFLFCSDRTKGALLAPVAPHLAEIGVHKNGTWSAQKIIDYAKTDSQQQMIVDSLRPYTIPLFLDQFGNYVLQCCLHFGPPYTDFLYETMISRLWTIAKGRFSSRGMRACLESHHSTKNQLRMVASAIVLHSPQLAVISNGALLITWFLDTCNLPHRRTVLAPQLVPHLTYLCTHKVAHTTVLKVINQRNEPEAREIILKAIFFSPGNETLENILKDPTTGATMIFKALTTPFHEEPMRAESVKAVVKVLTKLKTTPNQGYKRLMDEVGLSRSGSSRDQANGQAERSSNRQPPRQPSGNAQHAAQRQYNGQYPHNMQPQPFHSPAPMSRSTSSEHVIPPFDSYPLAGIPPGALAGYPVMNSLPYGAPDPMNPLSGPLQYSSYYAAPPRQVSSISGGVYTTIPAPNGLGYHPSQIENYRVPAHHSAHPGPSVHPSPTPLVQQPGFAPVTQFSPIPHNTVLAGPAPPMYTYPQNFYTQVPPAPQVPPPGPRRGRR